MARFDGFARRVTAAVFCVSREEQRQGEKKMGRGKEGSGARGLSNSKPRRGEGRTWERGLRPRRFPTEREEGAGAAVGEERADKMAPPVSGKERGRERGGRLGRLGRK
jgi:hypothetical protein